MSRVLLLLLPLLAATTLARAAEVFVIADTANQTVTIAENAKETIAEANDIALANDTVLSSEDEHAPVVRKKRTFGDVVFRGLADVLGYSVARKPPQVAFPPPLAPVPGIDAPLQVTNPPQQAIPYALVPVALAPAPAAAPAQAAPCGAPRAAGTLICRSQAAAAPPPPKPAQPPCAKPRANVKPKPKATPQQATAAQPPCGRGRANPTTPSPCAPAPPPSTPPKADTNLETITSNFRLDFNFNRAQATPAPAQAAEEEQVEQQEQEQIVPVVIQPRAAKLPQEPPRTPRVYVDAFVVRNGVAKKVHAVDARNLNQNQADDDYLVYDEEEQPQQNREDDYEYVEESRDRKKAVRDFGQAVDRFWEQKQRKPKKKLPANDYRNIHFGDRELVNQIRFQNDEKLQSLKNTQPKPNRIPIPLPEAEEEDEFTTTTQDPRRRLKPRVLPPTEHNPSQIDTVTVHVPPIYKEKRPKKLHRERPERPDRDEEDEEVRDSEEREYSYDSDTDNSDRISQTEKPKRKRRRKSKRKSRSTPEAYSAGDYDYFGKKLPISDEENFFRGLTIPPPTKDADVLRLEKTKTGDGHFLDDHERLQDDKERINDEVSYKRRKDTNKEHSNDDEDDERADEAERSEDTEEHRTSDDERTDDTERSDQLSPNARVRETGYQNNYVHSTNVQVDDPRPPVTVEKKVIGKA